MQTRCQSKDEYLTRPDYGRCFDEENQKKLRAAIPGTPRVQIVIGDGLSSAAITANAMDCLESLKEGLKLKGIDPGTPIFVRYCRVRGMPSETLPAVSWCVCWWGSVRAS